jgi:2-keto-4-pentenoate hydratase/2-oxohepta-3-ene-1,7-dioic acid hydratase in catechol pathway
MRLCRYSHASIISVGLYLDDSVIPLLEIAKLAGDQLLLSEIEQQPDCMERLLSPCGDLSQQIHRCITAIGNFQGLPKVATSEIALLPPIAAPPKLLLLAGNYVEHILEQGDLAAERANTFPYVFMKPAGTTLRGSDASVAIPANSPNKIDYELELAVVIGKEARNVPADEALKYVAGYTIINDLSDRGFCPNPSRQERPRDKFFDWLHGKWHDGFCPCGPCLTTADEIPDPQALKMSLSVDGKIRQDASTSLQVFSVAEVISFISSFMTLSPGDIISTGTPSGVGNATGDYLKDGQRIEATIEKIGTLVTTMVADKK